MSQSAETIVETSDGLWVRASGVVSARSWRTLGIFDFPSSVEGHVAVIGAVGVQSFDGLLLWSPVVAAAWLPIKEFTEATKSVRFSGPVPIWAKNETDSDVEFDARVRFSAGTTPPAAPDVTPAYYASRVWRETRFLGVDVLKHPCDLWVMQEILHDVRPDLVIETGTFKGGSALFLATTLQSLGNGRVVTIDVEDVDVRIKGHGRVTFLRGSSVDPEILDVAGDFARGKRTLVVLDSDHSYDHVLAELRAYAPLVSEDSYLVCEDTNTPGPAEAVKTFLSSPEGAGFAADRSREKFGSTFNPSGYLKKMPREGGGS